MNVLRLVPFLALLAAPLLGSPWKATFWQNENALTATSPSGQWVAIVSLDRGRLVHLGTTAKAADNLLFAPPAQDNPLGWGGHRAWLGPQNDWPGGWPPPTAWEKSAAQPRLLGQGQALVLTPPPTGDEAAGWPNLSRGYQWRGESLLCFVAAQGHPDKDVQIIQILQVPPDAVIEAEVEPTPDLPRGYVLLPSWFQPERQTTFDAPPHEQPAADFTKRAFHFVPDQPAKFGFTDRPLIVRRLGISLTLRRGDTLGATEVGQPDQGFNTHLYLGGNEDFIEVEQLSPLLQQSGRQLRTFGIELSPRIDR